jgi:hypothetical protein
MVTFSVGKYLRPDEQDIKWFRHPFQNGAYMRNFFLLACVVFFACKNNENSKTVLTNSNIPENRPFGGTTHFNIDFKPVSEADAKTFWSEYSDKSTFAYIVEPKDGILEPASRTGVTSYLIPETNQKYKMVTSLTAQMLKTAQNFFKLRCWNVDHDILRAAQGRFPANAILNRRLMLPHTAATSEIPGFGWERLTSHGPETTVSQAWGNDPNRFDCRFRGDELPAHSGIEKALGELVMSKSLKTELHLHQTGAVSILEARVPLDYQEGNNNLPGVEYRSYVNFLIIGNSIIPATSYHISKTFAVPVGRIGRVSGEWSLNAVQDFGFLTILSLDPGVPHYAITVANPQSGLFEKWQKAFDEATPTDKLPSSAILQYTREENLKASLPYWTYQNLPRNAVHFIVDATWGDSPVNTLAVFLEITRDELLTLYKTNQVWFNTYDKYIGYNFAGDWKLPQGRNALLQKIIKNPASCEVKRSSVNDVHDGVFLNHELLMIRDQALGFFKKKSRIHFVQEKKSTDYDDGCLQLIKTL